MKLFLYIVLSSLFPSSFSFGFSSLALLGIGACIYHTRCVCFVFFSGFSFLLFFPLFWMPFFFSTDSIGAIIVPFKRGRNANANVDEYLCYDPLNVDDTYCT